MSAGYDGVAMGFAWKLHDTVFGLNQGCGIELGNLVDAEVVVLESPCLMKDVSAEELRGDNAFGRYYAGFSFYTEGFASF